MNITKEQIEELLGFIDKFEDKLNEWFPEAFEPEVQVCALWKAGKDNSIVPDTEYCTEVDTGVWEIFDARDYFWLKSPKCVFKFFKKSPHGFNSFFEKDSPEFQRLEKP